MAIVTGGARGIGAVTSSVLSRAGARTATIDLNGPAHSDNAADLHIKADVTKPAEVRRVFEHVSSTLGTVRILVNNAGTSVDSAFSDITMQDWDYVLAANAKGSFLCAQMAMESMKVNGYGRIVQVSSVVAHQGALFGHAHYAASKSALLGLTRTLSRVGAPYGITANAVAPGVIATELSESTLGRQRVRQVARDIPLGVGTANDVAHAILYLVSREARYVTGVTLDVNGGQYIR